MLVVPYNQQHRPSSRRSLTLLECHFQYHLDSSARVFVKEGEIEEEVCFCDVNAGSVAGIPGSDDGCLIARVRWR